MTKYFPLDLWRAFTETKEEIPNEISLQSEFLYWFNQSESIFFFFIFSPPLFASVFPAIFLLYAGNLYFTFSKNHEIFKTINFVLGPRWVCLCVCLMELGSNDALKRFSWTPGMRRKTRFRPLVLPFNSESTSESIFHQNSLAELTQLIHNLTYPTTQNDPKSPLKSVKLWIAFPINQKNEQRDKTNYRVYIRGQRNSNMYM